MSRTTPRPPSRWRAKAATLIAAGVALATTAGLTAGPAAAHGHDRAQRSSFGQGWHSTAPNDYPVPGIDYSLSPPDLQPTPISVLRTSPHLASGSIFVAAKITTPGTPGQQGPEIIDNQGRPIWFQSVDAPYTATDFRVQSYRGRPVLTPEHRRPGTQRGRGRDPRPALPPDRHGLRRRHGAQGRSARVPPHPAGHGADHRLPPRAL